MQISFETHQQYMACLNCGLAGYTPKEGFPQELGLWDSPCPRCDAPTVWVTPVRASQREELEDGQDG